MPPFTLNLKLDVAECLRGESVFFTAVLENTSGAPVRNVQTLNPDNHVFELRIEGAGVRRGADGHSPDERDGKHYHGPLEKEVRLFNPRDTMSVRADLLAWFGELAPGAYDVHAHFKQEFLEAHSAAVKLRVLPASIAGAFVPRFGEPLRYAQRPAAWVHRAEKEQVLFYQRQSQNLPRNTRHSLRVATVPGVRNVWPAALPVPAPEGHLIWADTRDKIMISPVQVDLPRAGAAAEVRVPYPGEPLDSPLTWKDGVLMLWTDARRQKVALLRVANSGNCAAQELDLEKSAPLGAYAAIWEFDARLHFAWATAGGREVRVAKVPLADAAAPFMIRPAFQGDDPVAWIEGYADLDLAFADPPYFQEQLPEEKRDELTELQSPPIFLWVVTAPAGRLVCHRVNLANGQSKAESGFALPGNDPLRVVGATLTHRHALCMLLADSKDQLYYASTTRGKLLPLSDLTNKDITLEQFPSLLAAAETALEPWVHLRYVERKVAIEYARLEPDYQRDPVERRA